MKITVMIQYYGHVINAGGNMTYRSVTVTLTDEQAAALELNDDEAYGPTAIEKDDEVAA